MRAALLIVLAASPRTLLEFLPDLDSAFAAMHRRRACDERKPFYPQCGLLGPPCCYGDTLILGFSVEDWVRNAARLVEEDPTEVRSQMGWWRVGSSLEKAEPLIRRHPKLWEMWQQQRAADWFEWPPRR